MNPEQQYGPQQQNPYDFIMNPGQAPKKTLLPKLGGGSFTKKIILIIAGAVIVVIIMWILGSIFGGSSVNKADVITLTQMQEEIARVSARGQEATDQAAKNMAINVKLTIQTQQKEWLDFLAVRGTEVKDEQLGLKKNEAADTRLEEAKANNTYDLTFNQTMETYLNQYITQLETDFNKAAITTQKELIQEHYNQTKILLEQIPKT